MALYAEFGFEGALIAIGNTIENAPAVGIQIGWGTFMRDVSATGNVIRHARVGISVTGSPEAGKCLIANNLISNAKDGAIREMQFGEMMGPDLVREQGANERIRLTGNVAVWCWVSSAPQPGQVGDGGSGTWPGAAASGAHGGM